MLVDQFCTVKSCITTPDPLKQVEAAAFSQTFFIATCFFWLLNSLTCGYWSFMSPYLPVVVVSNCQTVSYSQLHHTTRGSISLYCQPTVS